MKKLYFIFVLLFSCLAIQAQELHVASTRFYGGDSCHTGVKASIKTSDNGILLGGYTYCNNKGDIPVAANYQLEKNLLIVKTDISGQPDWVKIFGGSADEEAYSVCQTQDGGYAVLGITNSSDGDINNFQGITDLLLIKLDAQGNLLWKKTYGSPFNDIPVSVTETPYGELVIFAGSNGSGGDIPTHYGGGFSFDWLLIKTDAQGNKKWCKVYGGTGDDEHDGSLIVMGNNYFLASGGSSTDIDCYDVSWFGANNTEANCHLLKLDTAGILLWDKSYGGSQGEGIRRAIFDERDSSIVMIGPSNSYDYMVDNPQYLSNLWLLKTDLSGNIKWSRSLTQAGFSYSTSSALANTEFGYAGIGNGGGLNPMPGLTNLLFWAIDTAGTVLTNKRWGGLSHERVVDIHSYNNNNYRVTGESTKPPFTEGNSTGQQGNGVKAFISSIDFWAMSIGGMHLAGNMKVYPNPVKDILYIEPEEQHRPRHVTIINDKGEMFLSKSVEKGRGRIEVLTDNWPTGTYFIRLQCNNDITLTSEFIHIQ